MGSDTTQLLHLLDEAYDHEAWHGPNLRGSFNRVTVQQALLRPTPKHRNLWELALHCAYWKYIVWRRIVGGPKGGFPRKGSDWFARSEGSAAEWTADIALLDEIHGQLRQAVTNLDPSRLEEVAGGSYPLSFYIRGVAMHDVYHAGQAQWVKQALATRTAES